MDKEEELTTKQRLKAFIQTLDISEREFCRRLGVSTAYVESIKKSISPKVMKEIGAQYPQLNPVWLLLGSGEMLLKTDPPASPNVAQLEQMLKESRADRERLLSIVESQQRTIETLANNAKKEVAQQGNVVGCADAG